MELSTLTTAARALSTGYKYRYTLQKWYKLILASIDRGATNIVVTGHERAGKTVLVHQLIGKTKDPYYRSPAESLEIEVEAITIGSSTKLTRVLPGQASRRVSGEIESFRDNPDLQGVIHVVDFGYRGTRDKLVEALQIERGIDTFEKTIELNLENEIDNLISMLTLVRHQRKQHNTPKWILIVINKVDLYHSSLNIALNYYSPGGDSKFSKALDSFQKETGILIYVIPCSAFEEDFRWNGIKIESTLKNEQRNTYLIALIEKLKELMER